MKNKIICAVAIVAILSFSILARNEFAFIKNENEVFLTEMTNGHTIGLLNQGTLVDIVEKGEEWTKIRIEGWVKTDSLVLGEYGPRGPLLETSRAKPAVLGDVIIFSRFDFIDGQIDLEMELLEVITGEEAWSIIRQANMYNEEPGEDEEYILAKFRIRVNGTEKDVAFNFTHVMFEAVSETGVVYSDIIAVSGLLPNLRAVLYEGAEHSGWTYFLVRKDDKPVVAFDRRKDSEQWFQLRY